MARGLDWTPFAPIRICSSGHAWTSPEALFGVLTDHPSWPEWFPAVRSVEIGATTGGAGSTRTVRLRGGIEVVEEVVVWEPGRRWTSTATRIRPGVVRSLVTDCQLVEEFAGASTVRFGIYLEPTSGLGPLVRAMAGEIRSALARGVYGLCERATATQR